LSTLALALLLQGTAARELVVGTVADPGTLEPHRSTDLVAEAVIANVCETLVRPRPGSGRPEAALATSWATADHRVWTFALREGVRFQDGSALDADAVVANFDHLQRERRFAGRARRIGPSIVQLVLERADATLLATLSQPSFSIESPRQLASGTERPVCTGPFRVESARAGLVELRRWDGYWGEPPRLVRVLFRRFPDADAVLRGLVSGTADVTSAIRPQQAAAVRRDPLLALDSQTGLNLVYLALNDERQPLDDARVRRGIARALDRAALVRLLGGHAEVAHGPLPPSVLGRDPRAREPVLDRGAAERLLRTSGVRPGTPLTLSVSRTPRPYLSEPLRIAARLRDDLEAVGFSVKLLTAPSWAEQIALTKRGDYDVALLGWRADTLEPADFLGALLESRSVGTTNRSRYRSPAMDALLARARAESAADRRLRLYRRAQQLFERDMPFVPLFHASTFTAHRREVRGLSIGPTGIVRYERAWKQP
jgi:peptide/nickel transport system substrate-binding protein